jgi:glycosyltransferase involved in cell wall biosynthesis
MKNTPISVVMSVFNGEVFLEQAIESMLNQSFGDFEFVIIDDGSTDRTPEILSDYRHRDTRIKVFRHDNKGRAESLNVGIGLATGKYIARMDADDIALPHRLEKQIEFIQNHADVGVLGAAYELIDAGGQVINVFRPPLTDSEIRLLMLHYNPMCHPAILMRRDVVLASGGYRAPLLDADDYDLFLRMADRSKLANLGDIVLQYRVHANQVSVRNMRHQALCVLAAQTAASVRRSGGADPLAKVNTVTPELLNNFGVDASKITEYLVEVYTSWMNVLGQSDREATLRVIDELLSLPSIKRSVIADASLRAAGIHYRKGRLAKAIKSGGRAALANPMIFQRLVKRAFKRVVSTRPS